MANIANSIKKTGNALIDYIIESSTAPFTDSAITDMQDLLGIGTARRTNEFNAQQAQIQRDWEEKMSNTAYQRAMNDMQAAGINPAMALSSGASSASTPAGASASGVQASGRGNVISSLINSAANLSKSFNSDKNVANDINNKSLVKTIIKLGEIIS